MKTFSNVADHTTCVNLISNVTNDQVKLKVNSEDAMRKIQFWAVFWTLVIAIPLTILALIASAYLTDHLVEIVASILSIDMLTLAQYGDLILEIEVIGMVLGVAIIIAVILITLQPENGEQETN
jgi:hypothetical protein